MEETGEPREVSYQGPWESPTSEGSVSAIVDIAFHLHRISWGSIQVLGALQGDPV